RRPDPNPASPFRPSRSRRGRRIGPPRSRRDGGARARGSRRANRGRGSIGVEPSWCPDSPSTGCTPTRARRQRAGASAPSDGNGPESAPEDRRACALPSEIRVRETYPKRYRLGSGVAWGGSENGSRHTGLGGGNPRHGRPVGLLGIGTWLLCPGRERGERRGAVGDALLVERAVLGDDGDELRRRAIQGRVRYADPLGSVVDRFRIAFLEIWFVVGTDLVACGDNVDKDIL